ncbi:MAG: hypothetical protein K6E40_00220 [Desulfovibrio sp.]|nr:hypothetical protein [Desulfovibrio sp.]
MNPCFWALQESRQKRASAPSLKQPETAQPHRLGCLHDRSVPHFAGVEAAVSGALPDFAAESDRKRRAVFGRADALMDEAKKKPRKSLGAKTR